MAAPRSFRLVGWLVAALLVLLAAALPWSPHTKLTFAGALLEICGIVMLTWDVFGSRVVEDVSRRARTLRARLTDSHTSSARLGVNITGTSGLSAVVTTDDLKEQVDRLVAQVAAVERWQAELPRELEQTLEQLRSEMGEAMESRIGAAEAKFLQIRKYGFCVALVGSAVLAAANLF